MRKLSPFAKRSRGRALYRDRYRQYMASSTWFRRREQWYESEVAAFGTVMCKGKCGREWTPNTGDLHHVTYDRLGNEEHHDLWPLCRECHALIHQIIESSRSWRRLPRRQANQLALARLATHQ